MGLSIYLKCEHCRTEREFFGTTHNLAPMWRIAGVMDALYESDGHRAGEFLPVLRAGLAHMEAHPDVYTPLNPANGWGNYEGALEFLREWIAECEPRPEATIVSLP